MDFKVTPLFEIQHKINILGIVEHFFTPYIGSFVLIKNISLDFIIQMLSNISIIFNILPANPLDSIDLIFQHVYSLEYSAIRAFSYCLLLKQIVEIINGFIDCY